MDQSGTRPWAGTPAWKTLGAERLGWGGGRAAGGMAADPPDPGVGVGSGVVPSQQLAMRRDPAWTVFPLKIKHRGRVQAEEPQNHTRLR